MDGDAAAAQAEQGAADGCGRVNLALLAYYKYANFFVSTLNDAARTHFNLAHIFLPWRSRSSRSRRSPPRRRLSREPADYDFIDYCLFVVFFPHLIAGPVVRHHEILPQIRQCDGLFHLDGFRGADALRVRLFTKTVLADSVAPYGATIFAAVDHGATAAPRRGVGGALAYTCQLYFDFSGYSTMALGLGYSSTSACR